MKSVFEAEQNFTGICSFRLAWQTSRNRYCRTEIKQLLMFYNIYLLISELHNSLLLSGLNFSSESVSACMMSSGIATTLAYKPGPSISLKFQTLILQIHCYFLLKKCENPLHCKGSAKDSHIFSTKNNSVFVTFVDICLTNLRLNDISLS